MAAGVHDGNGRAGLVLDGDRARVGEAGGLLDGEGVELRPDEDGRSLAVRRTPTTPVPPTCSVTSKPRRSKFRGRAWRPSSPRGATARGSGAGRGEASRGRGMQRRGPGGRGSGGRVRGPEWQGQEHHHDRDCRQETPSAWCGATLPEQDRPPFLTAASRRRRRKSPQRRFGRTKGFAASGDGQQRCAGGRVEPASGADVAGVVPAFPCTPPPGGAEAEQMNGRGWGVL